MMAPPRIAIEDRFWAKVEKGRDGECWGWTGTTSVTGLPYGRLSLPGRESGTVAAHRLSWELHNGAIPEGIFVLHQCDNPRCTNPAHIFLGTHADNMADRNAKGRQARQQGIAHGMSTLTPAIVRSIRAAPGLHRDVAARFGVHKSHVSQIKRRVLWPHVLDAKGADNAA